ncbi:MAG TPA: DUF885 domain-containing protein, partial [Thermoanaerobaculia bacterium]|nr:DUF885 domain-containing protein [Thermoanaerobaculia bacterium]
SARLARLFDLYWAVRMRELPDLATYSGYRGLDDLWPDQSPAAIAAFHRIARAERTALASIDASALAESERVDKELLRRRLELQIEGERFHELEPFRSELLLIDQMDGIDQDLVSLLTYMPARTVADFETMLARLRGFPAAADQTIAALARGLAAGITPPRVTLRSVPDRVRSLAAQDPLKSPALEPFRRLPETIPAAERERLRKEAVGTFTERVVPALRKLSAFLETTYVPRARETVAMSDLPDGKAWYAFALRSYTTTSLGPEEIHRLGLAEVARLRAEMKALVAASGFQGTFAEYRRFLLDDPRFFYDRPEDLVAGYRDIAKRIDPELVKLFGRLPRLPYGVKEMEGDAAKTAPAAYYSAGAPGGGMPGWFLVNSYDLRSRPKWAMESLTLHEAVPGHHLQYALAAELGELPEWRRNDVYPPFSEGWALYAESLGSELGLYSDAPAKFGRLSNEMWRALRLVVDTGLHANGWTRQQAIDAYAADSGKPAREIEAEVDRVIARPGTVPVYKLGELKIRELRSFAERELGAAFDTRAFHDHLLGHGQLPLDFLEKRVQGWVERVRRGTEAPGRPR